MATFSKKLFKSLSNLSEMSQYLVVINNIQGITAQEADALKELAFAKDPRLLESHQSFMTNHSTNTLVSKWRKILAEVKGKPGPIQTDFNDEPEVYSTQKGSKSPNGPKSQKSPNAAKSPNRLSQLLPAEIKSPTLAQGKDPQISGNDLIVLRDKIGLGNIDPRSLIAKARSNLKNLKTLNFEDFSKFITGVEGSEADFSNLKKKQILKVLFDNFDQDKKGELDKNHILNSLIVVCGGTPETKSEATFMLYDINNDGLISFDELLEHQISVFKILHKVRPEAIDKTGETPESLARVTVESIFNEADADGDGVLSLAEFQAWVKGESISDIAKEEKKAHVDEIKSKKEKLYQQIKAIRKSLTSEDTAQELMKLKISTGLGDVHVTDALKYFREHSTTGFLTRKQFSNILLNLICKYTDYRPQTDVFNNAVNQLYVNFDRDGNGVVDFSELFCGLSMLCAGNAGDKLKGACDSYDESSDGKMQVEEVVKYFTSVFSVLLGAEAKSLISPEHLAKVTAKELFKMYEIEEDGEISYEDLKDWFDRNRVLL